MGRYAFLFGGMISLLRLSADGGYGTQRGWDFEN